MNASRQNGLEQRLADAWPPSAWRDSHVVLAVSGGADSVALLRATLKAKAQCGGSGSIFVAHFNHGWRGVESDQDQAWLAELCRKLGVPFQTARADAAAIVASEGDGLEAAARRVRYEFFTEVAHRLGARLVALAHTADDQVETILHRIVRGTGVDGLAGMPFTRPLSHTVALVRPLLTVRRSQVLAYLSSMGQDYRTDATNADVRWTRNRLRHELLPMLRDRFNAKVDDALLRLAAQASESQQVVDRIAQELADQCVRSETFTSKRHGAAEVELRIDCRTLAIYPPLLVREVCKIAWQRATWPLQSMGYDEWQQLAEMVHEHRPARITFPGNIHARWDDERLILHPARPT